MKRCLLLALLIGLALPALAQGAPRNPRLAGVNSFAFAIGTGGLAGDVGARYGAFDLVIVDGEEATAAQIASMQAQGTLVLGYLSVGTIERGRFWFRRSKRFRLDKWEDFGEWYADVSRGAFRRLLAKRVAPRLLGKGFDGLFLDNTDMIETHRAQKSGMRKLVKKLAALAHGRGGLLFAQNGESTINPLLPYYDGWNREDVTWTYSFKRKQYKLVPARDHADAMNALVRIGAAGLLTMATDYVAAAGSAAEQQAVQNACSVGALPFASDIWLTRIPATPLTCP